MPDDPPAPPPDAEELQPDPVPPLVLAKRTDERDRRRDDRYDDEYEDDDRDARYHPRGRDVKYDEDGYEITQNDIMWAVFAYGGLFVASFLAPLVILFAVKSPFVTRHAKASLNQFLTVLLITFIALILGAAVGFGTYAATQEPMAGVFAGEGVYMLFALPLAVANIVYIILAIIAAAKGREYRCPYAIRFIG
jgi:uncharacterized Tic20 family protein